VVRRNEFTLLVSDRYPENASEADFEGKTSTKKLVVNLDFCKKEPPRTSKNMKTKFQLKFKKEICQYLNIDSSPTNKSVTENAE